jgi:MFS family permease
MVPSMAAQRRRSPLAHPAFRRVWIGATISSAGDGASWVALVALALGATHANLAVLVVLYTAPVAGGGLLAGWALDRFDRRRLMILDCSVRGAAFASIPIVSLFAAPTAIQLYAVAAVYGFLKMIGLAGFPSLIPLLVEDQELDQANALEGASFGLASLAGPTIAGVVIGLRQTIDVMAFDALSYLVLAACLLSVPHLSHESARAREQTGPRRRSTFKSTIRIAVSTPAIRATTIVFAVFNIGEGALLVLLPQRALQLGLGVGGYGYLVAVTTAGELSAALLLTRGNWRRPLGASILVAALFGAAAVLLLIVRSISSTIVALVILGFCSAPMTAWAQTLRMRLVPSSLHGRLFAVLRTAMQATPPLGAGVAALTLPRGATLTVIVITAMMSLPALLLRRDLLADGERSPQVGALVAELEDNAVE